LPFSCPPAASRHRGFVPVAPPRSDGHLDLLTNRPDDNLPWDSWQKPYVNREPAVWFHEVFRQDGTPYKQDEVDLIRSLTGAAKPVGAAR
jgi:hypothetical protein